MALWVISKSKCPGFAPAGWSITSYFLLWAESRQSGAGGGGVWVGDAAEMSLVWKIQADVWAEVCLSGLKHKR